jgi:hypothetical protein
LGVQSVQIRAVVRRPSSVVRHREILSSKNDALFNVPASFKEKGSMAQTQRTYRILAALFVTALLLTFVAARSTPVSAQMDGELIYALTADNQLVQFNSSNPASIITTTPITGLPAEESLRGIDFRPANGELFALGASSRLYMIDPMSGAATAVGSEPIMPEVAGTVAGFDFNPVPDRIRIISTSAQNLRVNPADAVAIEDGMLAYAEGDTNAGAMPNVVAAGYTNPVGGAVSTQLFVIDSTLNILALQSPPNDGVLNTIGALGIDVGDRASFDISTRGMAYVSYAVGGMGPSQLGMLNLSTGAISPIGAIGANLSIVGIALPTTVTPPSEILWLLDEANMLRQIRSDAPGMVLSEVMVSGLEEEETLLAIDFRPATGQLFAVSSASRLYQVNPLSGRATAIGMAPLDPALANAAPGFDFNPVPDRIRIVAGSQNLRANPSDGSVIVDGELAYAEEDTNNGQTPVIVAAGYTNSVRGATSTALYVVDAELNILALQSPPNDGVLNTIGTLGLNVDERTTLDISRSGTLYIAYSAADGMSSMLGVIDLESGRVTPVGPIAGAPVRSMASPTPFIIGLPLIGS